MTWVRQVVISVLILVIFRSILSYCYSVHNQSVHSSMARLGNARFITALVLQIQQQNETASGNFHVDTILAAIVTAVFTLLGTLIGYLLTSRIANELENRNFNRAILKGIRSLVSELEDNENLIKDGKRTTSVAWEFVRHEPWFLPPIISEEIENQLKDVYKLLDSYDEEIETMLKANPRGLPAIISKYSTVHDLPAKLQTAEKQLGKDGQKVARKIWKA